MKPSWLRFDFILFFTILALLCFGLAMIYSSTIYPSGNVRLTATPVFRQGVVAVFGVILIFVLTFIDYSFLGYHPLGVLSPITRRRQEPSGLGLSLHHEQYSNVEREPGGFSIKDTILLLVEALSNPFYLLALALLVAVTIVGKSSLGAQRWINLGVFDLQPSEVAKLMVILALARYLADHEQSIGDIRHLLVTIIQVAIPVLMIARQPDLGTALTIVAIWLAIIIMAGVPWRHLLLLGLGALAAMPVMWTHFLSDYQRERLLIFLNPQLDPLGAGYNIIQSRISVGAGGLLGRGLNSGTQSQLNFLRIQHTDYIFSVLAEELGFVGATLLIVLYGVLIMQALSIAANARDSFGRLVACGIAGMIVFQVFVNIGMNIGLSPVTGIPLPFISYGRSALVVLLVSMGILESIAWRRKEPEDRRAQIELDVGATYDQG